MLRLLSFVIVIHLVSGCTSYIADTIEAPNRMSFDISGFSLSSEGFYEDDFCLPKNSICMPFLYSSSAPCPKDGKLNFKFDINGSPFGSVNKAFQFDANDAPEYRGLVIMAHGFRSSSASSILMAMMFKCLGFDVLAIDLMGHGRSTQDLGYGVKDSELVNEFITQLPENVGPVILVGHSMGALTMVRVARKNLRVAGLYLLAPMNQFDRATVGVAKQVSPLLSKLVPDQKIRQGAELALTRANIDLAETNIINLITGLAIPTLIYGSRHDEVSIMRESELKTFPDTIEVLYDDAENHLSVIAFDDNQLRQFLEWLQKIMPENAQKERVQHPKHINLDGFLLVEH